MYFATELRAVDVDREMKEEGEAGGSIEPIVELAIAADDELLCRICFQFIEEPKLMQCGHTFCASCLSRFASRCTQLKCPYCLQVSSVNNVSALPENYEVAELLRIHEAKTRYVQKSASRVLVFGSSNVGKTSLVNALTRSNRPTGDSAVGTTMGVEEFPEIFFADKWFSFLDTVGLDESARGLVPAKTAASQLLNFIKSSRDGLSLLIYVFCQGSATEQLTVNYELFYKVIASERIPIIAAVTHCENFESDLSDWPNHHEKTLADRYGLKFAQVVGCCFASSGPGISEQFAKICEPLRELSRVRLLEAVRRHATDRPVRIFHPSVDGAVTLVRNVWNFLVRLFTPDTAEAHLMINKLYYKLLLAVGFSEQEARHEAARLEQASEKNMQKVV